MKTRFVFNPSSGRNRRNPELVSTIRAFIAAQHLSADVVSTEAPGHATVLARAAVNDGCTRIVAVGGDGTMNEVAQALIGKPVALGLLPCGSGNGLALHLGIPTNPLRALELLVNPFHRIAVIDTGSANGHLFCNAMGLGFDAEISRRFNGLTRRGPIAYARTGLAAFSRYEADPYVISGDEPRRHVRAFLLAVANSDQYGNHAFIAPGARVDDGMLDLVAIGPVNTFNAAPLLARLFLGNLDQSRRVLRLRQRRFVIERSAPALIHTDGETHLTDATVEIQVHPSSLHVVVPIASQVATMPRVASLTGRPVPAAFTMQTS